MEAKIIAVRSDLIDVGDPEISYIEGVWHVDLVVIGIGDGVTKEQVVDAYRDGVVFDVIPRRK
jgi:hypothetical protein